MRFKEFVNPNQEFRLNVPSGVKGPDIADLQKALLAFGYDLSVYGVDGIKGPETSAAVKEFQQDMNLTDNGLADKATIDKINELIKENPELVKNLKKSTDADVKGTSSQRATAKDGQGLKTSGGTNEAFKEPFFMKRLKEVAASLGVDENALIGIMKHESRLNPRAVNPMSRATGLIQFMPKTARELGTTVDDIYKMSATEQLDLVEKYYKRNGVKPGSNLGDLYMLTFMPAARNKPDNFILGNKEGGKIFGLNAAAVYAQNKVFDSDGDGIFTVGDVKNRINQFA